MVAITLELQTQITGSQATFKDVAKGLDRVSRGAISIEQLDIVVRRQLIRYMNEVATAMSDRHSTPWPGGTKATRLSKRTGDLIASIRRSIRFSGKLTKSGGERRAFIGSPLIYASIQEFGGTIRAKRAQYLTIPLPAAMDHRGIMLLPKARDYPNTFIAKSRKGNLIIFQKKPGRKLIPLFVLKKEVVIPPRLNLGKALQLAGTRFVSDVVEDALKEFRAGRL